MPTPAIVVILNPQSGSSDEKLRATIEKSLRQHNVEFEIIETTREKSAAKIVREAVCNGTKQIIACGGDGTVASAVNGLAQLDSKGGPHAAGVTFSIVPGGTANLLAAALDIPSDPQEAIEVALEGKERLIDLGDCGEIVFALGLGMGLTEKLVSGASTQEKEKLGRLAYVLAMLRELGQKPHRFSFKLDDGKSQTSAGVALVIANAGEISGKWKFAPDAKMDDGRLDLCILHRFYFRDFVRLLWRSTLGNLPEDRAVSFFQARKIEVETDPPLDLQIDGEEVKVKPPLKVSVQPGALKVRVPR